MERIAVISVYYGALPPYYRLWLRSCEYNPTIDFFLVTDIDIDRSQLPQNVRKISLSFDRFRELAAKKLGRSVRMDTPYKICDYKVMYGIILEDYLKGYDYWAHCDMDLIFGDLRSFLIPISSAGMTVSCIWVIFPCTAIRRTATSISSSPAANAATGST